MLQNELIVCFATVSWEYLWQRHHELMAQFARAGNRVLYIEPLGIRMPTWEDRHKIWARLKNRQRAGARGMRAVMENVWALDPLVNPFQNLAFAHRRNVRAVTQQTQRAVAQLGGGEPIAWMYAATPLARAVMQNLHPKFVVYDCVDALTENPKGVFASFAESEKQLSRAADVVFVSSPALLERQRAWNPRTYYVPHGVAYEKFANGHLPEPAALQNIPHPRLAFFGGIDERVDVNLLARLAARHPHWQLVLMGVVRTDVSALKKFPNAHFLGHIPHDALPAYLHAQDVLLLPYVRSEFSRYMNPAKLHECLAVGKPIIAIALPIFQEYRDVLYVADSTDEYETLIEHALVKGTNESLIANRRARARANTWEMRFAEITARMTDGG